MGHDYDQEHTEVGGETAYQTLRNHSFRICYVPSFKGLNPSVIRADLENIYKARFRTEASNVSEVLHIMLHVWMDGARCQAS